MTEPLDNDPVEMDWLDVDPDIVGEELDALDALEDEA